VAIIVFTNALTLVNSVDLSNHCSKVTTTDERAEVDVSAMGSGFVQVTKGLGNAQIDLELLQDFAGGSVHVTLSPLIGSTTPVPVEVRPVNAIRSASNPAMLLASALLFSYAGLDSQVGDAAKIAATFKNAPGGTGMTYPTS
jgi:hypothetical protein